MQENLTVSEQRILLLSVFILSLCGIIYELVLGSLATYFLGNPVQQYSITIGVFLSSMGLGSYLSRFFQKNILKTFIYIEVILGFIGGISIISLSFLFSFSPTYYLLHIFFLVIIGMLVGLEIPLITRILKKYGALKDILSNVLSLDYLGGLAGSLLFPLLLFPFVGRMLTSIIIGMVNIAIALIIIIKIDFNEKRKTNILIPAGALLLLILLAVNSSLFNRIIQKRFYDDVIFSKRTKFQEILLTRSGEDFRLYLDGALQFSSYDEYRYHEMLVLPALSLNKNKDKEILILGGGDGLAVRECLKTQSVKSIVLVELDQEIINLAKNNSSLKRLNKNSLHSNKVTIIVDDAYNYLLYTKKQFDVIAADFPDPHDETIAKLYTAEFFMLVKRALKNDGIFVNQSTSPYFATKAFWCIHNTMEKVFFMTVPYRVYIPSFGDWGFNLATKRRFKMTDLAIETTDLKFFSKQSFMSSLHFPQDIKKIPTEINTYNRPLLYNYYNEGWKHKVD